MFNYPYHVVDQSPWPLMGSLSAMIVTLGIMNMVKNNGLSLLMLGFIMLTITSFQWWRDVTREGTFQGFHTEKVMLGLKVGMILFIISEVMFFLSFFWAFFHSSLSPNVDIGSQWPPLGIVAFNPSLVPLLNTTILIVSAMTVTWSHYSMINFNYSVAKNLLFITILLGSYFTSLQGWEYYEASFSISDSIYGSVFFMLTGFHGLHVIIGTLFLMSMLVRMSQCHFSSSHHLGFEMAAWYWHFVDVVWLFLYSMVYWWGS